MTDDQYNGLLAACAAGQAASHQDLTVLVGWLAGVAVLLLAIVFVQVVTMVRGAA